MNRKGARAEAALDRRLESLETLLDRLPIGIERINLAGEILYSNSTHHRMLGYADGALVGRKIWDLVADPDEAARLRELFAALVQEQPMPQAWSGINRRRDGSTFEMRVDWQYERDANGELTGFVAAMSDISALRDAERDRDRSLAELEEERRHLESLKDSAVGFVLYRIAIDPEEPQAGRVVLVSPSIREVMGLDDPEDFSTWFANIHADDRNRILAANRKSAESGDAFDEIMRISHPGSGEIRWIRAISRPVLDEEGVARYFNGLILDVTRYRREQEERRELEQALQQSQRLESLGTLAGGIAHDFNNLLVGILGSSDLALTQLPEDSPAREQLQAVVTAAQRAADLTNQLLAYSGRGSLSVETCSLNQILEEMVGILSTAVSKKATIQLDLQDSLASVRVDARQIRQVIMNLITNASDALGDQPGTIRATSAEVSVDSSFLRDHGLPATLTPGRYVRVVIADDGCGMDPSTLDRIFEPFFTTKETGRGLGLAAVRGIIHSHLGALRVESEKESGTTCSVFLPVADIAESSPTPADSADLPTDDDALTVLIVDDEELVRKVAEKMLEAGGHRVLSAADGLEGLEMLATHGNEVDTVLLDMNMPRLSGLETFQRIRNLGSDVHVLLSSGYEEGEVSEVLATAEAVDFIQKPYRVDDLLDKIAAAPRVGRRKTV